MLFYLFYYYFFFLFFFYIIILFFIFLYIFFIYFIINYDTCYLIYIIISFILYPFARALIDLIFGFKLRHLLDKQKVVTYYFNQLLFFLDFILYHLSLFVAPIA